MHYSEKEKSEEITENKEVTIKDIAARAGVSVATVGRVIGNYGSVSPKTKEKVMLAAKDLNYVPNVIAQGMRTKSTRTIAIVVGSIKNSFFGEIVYAVERVARKNGYTILICNSHEKKELELQYMEMLRTKQVDGIILASVFRDIAEIPEEKRVYYGGSIPLVCVDRRISGLDHIDLIETANEEVAYRATKELLDLGHEKIGVFGSGIPMISTVSERLAGYRKALEGKNLPYREEYVAIFDWEADTNRGELVKYLNKHQDLTAIFILNNTLAASTFMALEECVENWRKKISLISWDEDEMLEFLKITTVEQQTAKIGTLAAERILELIDHPENKNEGMHITLNGKIHERASCRKR